MFNKTTEGLIKAAMLLAQAAQRPVKNPKFRYVSGGAQRHLAEAASTLTPEERGHYDSGDLHKLPPSKIKVVPTKYAMRQDHSRYTGERLREIRRTGGAREAARRKARLANEGPVQIAAE